MRLETTQRGVPPVTIEAARRQVRVADDSLDDLLGDCLRRACAVEEQVTGAALAGPGYRLWLDAQELANLTGSMGRQLPRWPVTGVSAVVFHDEDGDPHTATHITADAGDWSWVQADIPDGVAVRDLSAASIEFTAGFPAGRVPPDLEQIVLLRVAWLALGSQGRDADAHLMRLQDFTHLASGHGLAL